MNTTEERITRKINLSDSSRDWHLERTGKFAPVESLDVIEEICNEIGCSESTAAALLKADQVRIVDHHEIPRFVGHHVLPGSYGIAYRCDSARRLEDCSESES